MAVGQNQWYHFGVGAPPILVGIGMFTGVRDFDPWSCLVTLTPELNDYKDVCVCVFQFKWEASTVLGGPVVSRMDSH